MDKIFVIHQLLSDCRYTWDWYSEMYRWKEYYLMGDRWIETVDKKKGYNYFADLEKSIKYETDQINRIMNFEKIEKLLITDIDFPGLAVAAIPSIRLKFPNIKIYGMLHAGSYTTGDIYSNISGKKYQERSMFDLCDIVFVATNYHKQCIMDYFKLEKDNVVVTDGFFFNDDQCIEYRWEHKEKDILLLGRKEQFVKLDLDEFKPDEHTTLIPRTKYLKLLSEYKIIIISKLDEEFGYGPLEALAVGAIPLVPDSFGYKETLTDKFRFTNIIDLKEKITDIYDNYGEWRTEAASIDLSKYKYKFQELIELIKEN